MATITDYATLVTAVTEYLAREEDATLIARIPTFIQLAEAKFNRELFVRQMEQRSTAVVDTTSDEPEFIALPDDFQSMRSVRLKSTTLRTHLEYKTGVALDEFQSNNANVTGCPRYFTIMGDELEISPTPDSAYTIEMVYRKNIPALATNDPNWLLTLAPDIYLYGALLEAAPYMQNDARIQIWGLGFTTALDGLNRLGMASSYNAGPLVMQISGVTP